MTLPIPFPYIISIGLSVLVIALIIWNIQLERRLNRITQGKKAHDLEDTIHDLGKTVDTLIEHTKEAKQKRQQLSKKVQQAVRGIATVRFNPFADSGSNQSFATAFIDEQGDGVVVSSLYSRDKMRVFAKPVEQLTSSYELTEEEQNAIEKARSSFIE